MESKEFLEALETLKKSLEQINSAREQVESTVTAYNELETELSKYTQALGVMGMNITSLLNKTLAKEESLSRDIATSKLQFSSSCMSVSNEHKAAMKAVTDFFQTTCSSTNEHFSKECKAISERLKVDSSSITDDIKNKNTEAINSIREQIISLSTTISAFNDYVDKLQQATSKMDEVKSDINQLNVDIAKSQKEQDAVLNDISSDLKSFTEKQAQTLETISNTLTESQKQQDTTLENIVNVNYRIEPVVNNIYGALSTGFADTQKSIKSESSKLEGKIREESASIMQNVTTEFDNSKTLITSVLNAVTRTKSEVTSTSANIYPLINKLSDDIKQRYGKVPMFLYVTVFLNVIILIISIIK